MARKDKTSDNVTVTKVSHRKANIAVIIVVSIAALILIAIAVLCAVKVDPMRDIAAPKYYRLYDLNSAEVLPTNTETESKIGVALDDMDFNVMSAVLQWHWDYSYNFKRTSSDSKLEMTGAEVKAVKATETEYMVEFVYDDVPIVDGALDYSAAQKLKVDGETVYFDRLKILIGNTAGKVGLISMYPYISARIDNQSDVEGIESDTYRVTGINVRANTSSAFVALEDIVKQIGVKPTPAPAPEETEEK